MKSVSSDCYEALMPLFGEMDHHLSIRGVLTGAVAGRAYLSGDGSSAMVVNPQGFLFGGLPDPPFLRDCADLLGGELLPERAATGHLDYTVFFPQGWREQMEQALRPLSPMTDTRMTWMRDLNEAPLSLPVGVEPVTEDMLSRAGLGGLDWTLGEIAENWSSPHEFSQRGFGCVAITHKPAGPCIIAWCLTDWVVGNRCELGIEVNERYRRQGWGRRVAQGALALAAGRDIVRAGWQCWSSNAGSRGVVRSVGFILASEYPVLFGWNHPLSNALVNGNYYLNDHPGVGVSRDYQRAAQSYALALDQGWDWGGSPILYYNTACLFYKTGDPARARHYFELALSKGFSGLGADSVRPGQYVYHEPDAQSIIESLR